MIGSLRSERSGSAVDGLGREVLCVVLCVVLSLSVAAGSELSMRIGIAVGMPEEVRTGRRATHRWKCARDANTEPEVKTCMIV